MNKSKRQAEYTNWVYILIFCILVLYVITLLVPAVWTVMSSFKSVYEWEWDNNYFGFPKEFSFQNYVTAYKNFNVRTDASSGRQVFMLEQFLYSILYAGGCAIAATLTPCIVAYAVARLHNKFGKVIYTIVIVAMALPIVGSLPSEIQMARRIYIYGHIWGQWIMKMNFLGVYFLVFHAQFKAIPMDYTEAAQLDGASHFAVMVKVIMPLAMSTVSAVMLLNFITYWNDYQIPMIYIKDYPVLAYGMFMFYQSKENEIQHDPVKLAGILLMAIPIIIMFAVFNKKLTLNLSVGGIKG